MIMNQTELYGEGTICPVVSVIVITYNQPLSKLLKTLDSIIMQEGVSFEVIVCDDGSRINYERELIWYFTLKNFSQYTLLFHDKNRGTVINYYSGLEKARGEYSKLISPGDCLAGRQTLSRWIRFLRERKAEWSFSDTYYYRSGEQKTNYFRANAEPQFIRPYIAHDDSRCMWNYFALKDIANGAAILGRTQTQIHYCKIIKDYGIKYAEDHIYRLMMFHGIVGCYFSEAAIYYEYGTGISSSKQTIWNGRLVEDRKKLIQILLDVKNKSPQQQRMVNAFIQNSKSGKFRKICIHGKVKLWLRFLFHPRLTPLPEEKVEQS